jgi:hypothetical protein
MADNDLEHLPLIDVLARKQTGPLSPPMAQTVLLPLHELDPDMFERVVVELAWRVENARDVQLYGRRGQKQYGLDVVGTDRSANRFVYQARRLGTLTPAEIRQAVVDYAGPPRTPDSLEHSPPAGRGGPALPARGQGPLVGHETYVKVAGRWRYVYRAVDRAGQVVDVFVSHDAMPRPLVGSSSGHPP